MNLSEMIEYLAEQLVDCTTCDRCYCVGYHYGSRKDESCGCGTCAGSGKVPMFPELRSWCTCNGNGRYPQVASYHKHCEGRGFLVTDNPESALVPLMRQVKALCMEYTLTESASCFIALKSKTIPSLFSQVITSTRFTPLSRRCISRLKDN